MAQDYLENDVIRLLVQEEGIDHVDLGEVGTIEPEVISIIPEEIAVRHKVIPFLQDGNVVMLSMANPFDIHAQNAIQSITDLQTKFCFTPEAQIDEWLDKIYLHGELEEYDLTDSEQEIDALHTVDLNAETAVSRSEDVPAIRYVNNILLNAIQDRASDIHIEPQEKKISVRFRIDGALRDVASPPRHLFSGIVSRIKILSSLDIAERRVPQDGRSKLKIFGRNIDIRVSTLPTINGEKVVLRILDKDLHSLNIADLGMETELQNSFKQHLRQPHGMILVTGPTGSGKTTTLYSALNFVNLREKNIITVEDPVEYQLKGVNQVHARAEVGLSFSVGLRAILRQDPDIIMVGEIRDLETAEIALRASLTGHLVFSTLHTNNSIATIMRLIDMGIDRYLICSAVHLIMAQRLVRRVCFHCSEVYEPDATTLEQLGAKAEMIKNTPLRRGVGCSHCNNTGYWGRVAIFEMLHLDATLREMVVNEASPEELFTELKGRDVETLMTNGLRKVVVGATTVEEILRVSSDSI